MAKKRVWRVNDAVCYIHIGTTLKAWYMSIFPRLYIPHLLTVDLWFGEFVHQLLVLFPIRTGDLKALCNTCVGDTSQSSNRLENLKHQELSVIVFSLPQRVCALTAGSIRFLSSLIASSLAQNLTPSTTANTPVFLPGVALLSNSWVFINLHSAEKMASLTLLAFTCEQGAGVKPLNAHSETP